LPFQYTSSKGEPDENMTLPFEYSTASIAVHSERLVGFERAKIIGASSYLFISYIISGVNNPPTPDKPIRI
jgi:hypothetical protein